MGEAPENVHNVGALGIENAKTVPLLHKEKLERDIGFRFTTPTIMVTYHPVTLEKIATEKQFRILLDVIDSHKELSVIFTKANADTDGRIINKMIDEYVSNNKERCKGYTSLGQLRYLSTLQFCDAVVGNSSSGIIEVPSFKIPTVNIGNRQKGRICAESVINCGYSNVDIESALLKALSHEFRDKITKIKNPYEGYQTSYEIVKIIRETLYNGIDVRKKFYDFKVH